MTRAFHTANNHCKRDEAYDDLYGGEYYDAANPLKEVDWIVSKHLKLGWPARNHCESHVDISKWFKVIEADYANHDLESLEHIDWHVNVSKRQVRKDLYDDYGAKNRCKYLF